MDIQELKRTLYRDTSDPVINHETSDHQEDIEKYHKPKMRMHNAGLHGWGIAAGLKVRKSGVSQLVVEEGLAIDKQGRMIPLSGTGKAYINDVTVIGNLTNVPVVFDTSGFDDTYYLTIELPNTIITDPLGQPLSIEGRMVTEGTSERILNTPLVTLQQVSGFPLDDTNPLYGTAVVLAKVIVVGGQITSLTSDDRHIISIEVGEVVFKQGDETNSPPNTVIDTVPSAVMRSLLPSEGGGWKGLGISTNMVLFEDYFGRKAVKLDSVNSILEIGETGKGGKLSLKDSNGSKMIYIDATDSRVDIGGTGKGGKLFLKDKENRNVMSLFADLGQISLGVEGQRGKLTINDSTGRSAFYFSAKSSNLYLGNIRTDGTPGSDGTIYLFDNEGRYAASIVGSSADFYLGSHPLADGTPGKGGDIYLLDANGRRSVKINGENALLELGSPPLADGTSGKDGDLQIKDNRGVITARIDGNNAALYLGAAPKGGETYGQDGDLQIKDNKGRIAARIDGNNATLYLGASPLGEMNGRNGELKVIDYKGRIAARLNANDAALHLGASPVEGETSGQDGDLYIKDDTGEDTVRLIGAKGWIIADGWILSRTGIMTLSDKRKKKNVKKISNAINKIVDLQGVYFNWKGKDDLDDKIHLGLVAQDVQKVVPEVVMEVKNNKKDKIEYGINYEGIIPLLIESIKEQQNTIDKLSQRLGVLEKKNMVNKEQK